jgi:hypothetical protein
MGMMIVKLGFFGALFGVQMVWIVCESVQEREMCPPQPFGEITREYVAGVMKEVDLFRNVMNDKVLVNMLAIFGLMISIAEAVFLAYFLTKTYVSVFLDLIFKVSQIITLVLLIASFLQIPIPSAIPESFDIPSVLSSTISSLSSFFST